MGRFSQLETGDANSLKKGAAGSTKKAVNAPDQNYDAHYYCAEGDRLYAHGNFEKALRLYSRAAQTEKICIEAWIGQILCLIELKQMREAMVWATRAAELFPEEARIISLQGAVYASQGMTQRALGCSDYALSLGGFEPLIWVLRGIILSLADNSNAAACFSKAMEIRSADDWLTPMRIGLHLLREKKWQSSAEHLHAAAEISKSNDYLWERLGYANEALSLTNSAVEAYRAALQINSTNARAEAGLRRLCNTPFFTRIFRRILG